MLLQYLVPLLHELKQQPKVEKRGNRVTSISTRSGVHFRDVTRLLAPSTNLRKFGQLFGLEQAKAHFPFAALTSVQDLWFVGLPNDDSVWQSELSGELQTPEMLAMKKQEAKELFDKANCHFLGDYLREYLYLDVDILYKASQAWRRQLFTLIGLDFVECDRYTISGLSYNAGLKNLTKNQRIGTYFPNNSQMYRLFRQGMRG